MPTEAFLLQLYVELQLHTLNISIKYFQSLDTSWLFLCLKIVLGYNSFIYKKDRLKDICFFKKLWKNNM